MKTFAILLAATIMPSLALAHYQNSLFLTAGISNQNTLSHVNLTSGIQVDLGLDSEARILKDGTVSYWTELQRVEDIAECPPSSRTKENKEWLKGVGHLQLIQKHLFDPKSAKSSKTGLRKCALVE